MDGKLIDADAPLTVGDRIYDNDSRMTARVLRITEINGDRVIAIDRGGRSFRILRKRIYTDMRFRKTGFSRMYGEQP